MALQPLPPSPSLPPLKLDPLPPLPLQPQPELRSTWDLIKGWFHYSETIFLARATALVGLVIASTGYLDWSPLIGLDFSSGFSKTQALWTGSIIFIKGIVDELARRRNDPNLVK